jgi:hypothetical protein
MSYYTHTREQVEQHMDALSKLANTLCGGPQRDREIGGKIREGLREIRSARDQMVVVEHDDDRKSER